MRPRWWPAFRSRRWFLTLALVAALLLAIAWFGLARPSVPRIPAEPSAARHAGAAAARAGLAAAGRPSTPPDAGIGAPAAAQPGVIAECGSGWLQPKADGTLDETELAASGALTERGERRERLLDRLASEPDVYGRAVAAWLRRPLGNDDGIAAMAVAGGDPRVYALAYQSCQRMPDDGACRLLSTAQWARLDPGNAAPWLYALGDAAKSGDQGALDEALHRIATSARNESGLFKPVAPLLDAAGSGDDLALSAGAGMAFQAAGIALASPRNYYQPLLAACRGEAVRDANRLQMCRDAEVLADHSDELMMQTLAARIAANLGGPLDRVDRIRATLSAYSRASSGDGDPTAGPTCAGLRSVLNRLRAQADRGEVGAVSDWVAKSGQTAEEMARADARRLKAAVLPASASAGSDSPALPAASAPGAAEPSGR